MCVYVKKFTQAVKYIFMWSDLSYITLKQQEEGKGTRFHENSFYLYVYNSKFKKPRIEY